MGKSSRVLNYWLLIWLLLAILTPFSICTGEEGSTSPTSPSSKATSPATTPVAPSKASPPSKANAPPSNSTSRSKASPPSKAKSPGKASPPSKAPSPGKATSPSKASPPSKATSPPSKASPPSKVASPPSKAVTPLAPSPSSIGIAPAPGPAGDDGEEEDSNSVLDPQQVSALEKLGVGVPSTNPCSKEALLCNNEAPTRKLIGLQLEYCAPTRRLTTEAFAYLSTLQTLSFVDCPLVPPSRMPTQLLKTLSSLSCKASLGRTPDHPELPGILGSWLGGFFNLTTLTVSDVLINSSHIDVIVSDQTRLRYLTLHNTSIKSNLANKIWPPMLTSIDLSQNLLFGSLPASWAKLVHLQDLDLSHNNLNGSISGSIFEEMSKLKKVNLESNGFSGSIPESLATLPKLAYLSLANNRLNGSIPGSLSDIGSLSYLDLSNNGLSGPIPFNNSFVNKLSYFKISGNDGVCYDKTVLKSAFLKGVAVCDNLGFPISPFSPPTSSSSSSSSAADPDSEGDTETKQSRGTQSKTVITATAVTLTAAAVLVVVAVLVSRCRRSKY